MSVPALLLTVLATVAMYQLWPTKYQSNAELTLIGPQSLASQPGSGNNVYLETANLVPVTGILTSYLSSGSALEKLYALGVTDSFTASVPAFAAGPFVEITLTGKDPAIIRQSMPIAMNFVEQQLEFLQETGSVRTPAKGLIRSLVIAQPSAPSPVLKTKTELVAGIAISGLILLLLLSFSAEARAIRHSHSATRQINRTRRRGRGVREQVYDDVREQVHDAESRDHDWPSVRT